MVNTETRKRLAYLVTRAHHGGAQVHVLALLEHFRRSYAVHLAVGEEGFLTDAARRLEVPVAILPHLRREFSVRNDPRALLEIWRWLGSVRPAILHAHSSKAGMLGRVAAALRRTPVVFTAHGWAFAEGTPLAHRVIGVPAEWAAARLTDTIITVSEADRRLAERYRVRPRRRLVVIHNGISAEAPHSSARPDGRVELVCVARFSHQKDQALLVRALQGVPGSWRLRFVGDGPLEDEVRTLAHRCGLGDRVEFLGARDDVAELLAGSHVFVLPSHWEGFPITILEAMRAGLVVVASDVGGVAEAVEDGVTGHLVPPGDVDALRAPLAALIRDAEGRDRKARQARRAFLERHVDTRMFEATGQVYARVEARRSARGR